jgi:hypothetical protein
VETHKAIETYLRDCFGDRISLPIRRPSAHEGLSRELDRQQVMFWFRSTQASSASRRSISLATTRTISMRSSPPGSVSFLAQLFAEGSKRTGESSR